MQICFNAVSEPALPGLKWQKLFHKHWPAYKIWFESEGKKGVSDLKKARKALKEYMPEMWPMYIHMCKLVKADTAAACFLTGFQPPAYLSACSQLVLRGEKVKLVRNYDYHPQLIEGTQLLSAWNGKKVIATSDCLAGVLDGMNEEGLAVSLTFGGRKAVGMGFGIPFILRYVLEFCSNLDEAVAALVRIPCHMSYNVTVVDRTGAFKTIRLAPDKEPQVTGAPCATNHQGTVDWPENAEFNNTLERYQCLKEMLADKEKDEGSIIDAFLKPPLYSKRFSKGFGTLYTAVYSPEDGESILRWPQKELRQSFSDFKEKQIRINLHSSPAKHLGTTNRAQVGRENLKPGRRLFKKRGIPDKDLEERLIRALIKAMAIAKPSAGREEKKSLREKLKEHRELSWKALADFWKQKTYWDTSKN